MKNYEPSQKLYDLPSISSAIFYSGLEKQNVEHSDIAICNCHNLAQSINRYRLIDRLQRANHYAMRRAYKNTKFQVISE